MSQITIFLYCFVILFYSSIINILQSNIWIFHSFEINIEAKWQKSSERLRRKNYKYKRIVRIRLEQQQQLVSNYVNRRCWQVYVIQFYTRWLFFTVDTFNLCSRFFSKFNMCFLHVKVKKRLKAWFYNKKIILFYLKYYLVWLLLLFSVYDN